MTRLIIAFIFGIIFWQSVITIVALATDENEYAVFNVAAGLPKLILCTTYSLVTYLRLLYVKKNYWPCTICDGEHVIHDSICVKKKDVDKYYKEGENNYYLKVYQLEIRSLPCQYIEKVTKKRNEEWCTQKWIDENLCKATCK